MSTYKAIFGKTIKHLSSDPDNSTYEGQIWYNTTEGKFKTVVATAATSSGSSMITARSNAASFGNTRDASAAAAGYTGTVNTNVTEEFNGSGFSSGGNVNTTRRGARGTGAITAGLICSGYTTAESNATEEYDGSSWTNGGNLNTSRFFTGTFGTQTAGVAAGGNQPSPAKNVTEEYNGTSWTTVPATLSTGRENHMAGGTETAGIVCGGEPPHTNTTEEYDGSTWTSGGTLNTARAGIQGSGIQTAAIVMGGQTPTKLTSIETYNGTSWTTSPATLATARDAAHNAGTINAAMVSGGTTPGPTTSNTTEEYNFTANTITAGAWSSGGAITTARYTNAGAGTVNAGVTWGGRNTPIYQDTQNYDGTSWTSSGNYPKNVDSHGGTGSQTAALSVGGADPGASPNDGYSDAFEYDGTSWSSPSSMGRQGFGMRASGTQTAAVTTGGGSINGPNIRNTTDTEHYDGTSWTAANSFTTARSFHGTAGTAQTSSIVIGGRTGTSPSEVATNDVQEYDGTSWTAGGDYITVVKENTAWGTTNDCIQAGGSIPSATATCAIYDGTAWATTASLPATLNLNATSQGTTNTNSGFVVGGFSGGSVTTNTTEFNPESTALNIESVDNS